MVKTAEIETWKCSVCYKDLTFIDAFYDDEVHHVKHFDISRSNKILSVNEDGHIEEDLSKRNRKMERMVCEPCFNKIIQESTTLRSLFILDNRIIY
jgi:hypothetical protein